MDDGSGFEILSGLLSILPFQEGILIILSQHFESFDKTVEVLGDEGIEVLRDVCAFRQSLMSKLHDGLHKGKVDIEGFAVLEVSIGQIVDQSQTESTTGVHALRSALEEQEAEVEVDQIRLLSHVLLNGSHAFPKVLHSEQDGNYSQLLRMRWHASTIRTGISLALWVQLEPFVSRAKLNSLENFSNSPLRSLMAIQKPLALVFFSKYFLYTLSNSSSVVSGPLNAHQLLQSTSLFRIMAPSHSVFWILRSSLMALLWHSRWIGSKQDVLVTDCTFLLSFHQLSRHRIYILAEQRYTPSTSLFLEQPSLHEEQLSSSCSSFLIKCWKLQRVRLFLLSISILRWFFCCWMALRFCFQCWTKQSCTCWLIILPSWKYFTIQKQTEGILPSRLLAYSLSTPLLAAPTRQIS